MRSQRAQLKVVCLSLALGLVIATGCSKQDSPPDNSTAKPQDVVNTAKDAAPAPAPAQAEPATPKPKEKAPVAKKEAPAAKKEAPAPVAKAEEPAPVKAPPGKTQEDAALKLKLAAADMVDGVPDKIISKCPSCALSMDGHAEYSVELNGYTMYFCSESCKEKFSKDLIQSILALKLPGK